VGLMGERKIGLREVRALQPRQTIWDTALWDVGARRQKSHAVSYVLFYRTKEGRQRLAHDWPPRIPVDSGDGS